MSKKLNIGLFGFGCVGQGLYHVLKNSTGFTANISKIAVKDPNKKRSVPESLITYDKYAILNDPEIDVVVELIDDATEAYYIVREALSKGKHVVTANKKMLALHLEELYVLQKKYGVSLLYEGSVGGSIPILRTLEEYFDNENIQRISGILNGTTNYILTKSIRENMPYAEALQEAQEKGFAETDPTSDVQAFDPKFKAAIIALHAFGLIVAPGQILNLGITTLQKEDLRYASEKDCSIKLVPLIRRVGEKNIGIVVLPQFVKHNSPLFNVHNEFNGLVVEGQFSGEQFLQGRGAGSLPTGAAVLSDISALSYGYRYEYKKYLQKHDDVFTNAISVNIYLRYNSLLDLERLDFEEVYEKYTGPDYNYIIGRIGVQQLLNEKDYLLDQKLFVALVDERMKPANSKNSSAAKQQNYNH